MRTLGVILLLTVSMIPWGSSGEAVLGVADDVPAAELLIPFICEGHAGTNGPPFFGTLNTVWSIADTAGVAATLTGIVYNRDGVPTLDYRMDFTPLDVVTGDCQHIMIMMSPSQQAHMEVTFKGGYYFMGYVQTKAADGSAFDRYIGWVYMTDLTQPVQQVGQEVSGFKPFQAEGGMDEWFGELGGTGVSHQVRAGKIFPRYFILNDFSLSWNWWIVLTAVVPPATDLTGVICNEEEDCVSVAIPIPHRLNFINVADYLPTALHAGYPKGGFALLQWARLNPPGSTFAWSYQRACSNSVSTGWQVVWVNGRPRLLRTEKCIGGWNVIHNVDRSYFVVD